MNKFIFPNWPALKGIRAATTTKLFGDLSRKQNNPTDLIRLDAELKTDLQLPQIPKWLTQVHGNQVIDLEKPLDGMVGDASFSRSPAQICAVFTADCLPILVCDKSASLVAAIHAGWRGLLSGVIDNTIKALNCDPNHLRVWLGPAIGPDHFEVNDAIRQDYVNRHPDYALGFHNNSGHWFADLYQLAKVNLKQLGIQEIFGGGLCTYCDHQQFYSYRRDQGDTGRMVSLIWLEG